MAVREEKETVVVHDHDGEPRRSNAGVWAVVTIVVIVLLFLLFGGMSLFRGGSAGTGAGGSVQAPTTGTGTGQ